MSLPVEITNAGLLGLPPAGGAVPIGAFGRAEAGALLPSPTGTRFFYGTAGNDCLFVHVGGPLDRNCDLGKLYSQHRDEFVNDVSRGDGPPDPARRDAASVRTFLDVYPGVLRAAGGPRAWALTNMATLIGTGHTVPDYAPYRSGAAALLSGRAAFEKYLPAFHRSVLSEWFWGNVPVQPPSPCQVAGMWIGRIGIGSLHKRLVAIRGALKDVLLKVANHVADRNGKLDDRQADQLAGHVEIQLSLGGAVVPYRADSLAIIREVASQALLVRKAIRETSALLDAALIGY
jgi:hypothetical protein